MYSGFILKLNNGVVFFMKIRYMDADIRIEIIKVYTMPKTLNPRYMKSNEKLISNTF